MRDRDLANDDVVSRVIVRVLLRVGVGVGVEGSLLWGRLTFKLAFRCVLLLLLSLSPKPRSHFSHTLSLVLSLSSDSFSFSLCEEMENGIKLSDIYFIKSNKWRKPNPRKLNRNPFAPIKPNNRLWAFCLFPTQCWVWGLKNPNICN